MQVQSKTKHVQTTSIAKNQIQMGPSSRWSFKLIHLYIFLDSELGELMYMPSITTEYIQTNNHLFNI